MKGVTAKVITAAMLGGDCYPSTPIGINLPNADWIRRDHGSKSVTMENITFAYDKAAHGNGFLEDPEDTGLDGCFDDYENGWGGCLENNTYQFYLDQNEANIINSSSLPHSIHLLGEMCCKLW